MFLITWSATTLKLYWSHILTNDALIESESGFLNAVWLLFRDVSRNVVHQRLRGLFECLGIIERVARVKQHCMLIYVERTMLLVPFREPGFDFTTQRVKLVLVRDQEHVPNRVDGNPEGVLVSATMEDLEPDLPASRIISFHKVGGLPSVCETRGKDSLKVLLLSENLLGNLEFV